MSAVYLRKYYAQNTCGVISGLSGCFVFLFVATEMRLIMNPYAYTLTLRTMMDYFRLCLTKCGGDTSSASGHVSVSLTASVWLLGFVGTRAPQVTGSCAKQLCDGVIIVVSVICSTMQPATRAVTMSVT